MRSASQLSSAFANDPQMQLPQQPRLSDDLVQIRPTQQTLIFTGGPQEVVLRGRSVHTRLPRLLPLLDGSRTVEAICAALPDIPATSVRDTLHLLFMQGVLEEGKIGPTTLTVDTARQFQAVLPFYSRFVDTTRVHRHRFGVLERLQQSHVVIEGPARLVPAFATALADLGLGRLSWVGADAALSDAPAILEAAPASERAERLAGADLLVVLRDTPGDLEAINTLARAHGRPLLLAYVSPEYVAIGPAAFPSESACLTCATIQGLQEEWPQTGPVSQELSPEEWLGVDQLALEVLNILTSLALSSMFNAVQRLDFATMTFSTRALMQLPGCPECGIPGYGAQRDVLIGFDHAENLPTLYHTNTIDRSFGMFPKMHQKHYRPSNMRAAETGYKQYNNRPRYSLEPFIDQHAWFAPFETPFVPDRPAAPLADPAAALATLLVAAVGRQLSHEPSGWHQGQRVTPSGGGLTSQTLYVLNTGIAALPSGLSSFNPALAALEQLRPEVDRAAIDAAVPGAENAPEPLAIIIGTGALARVESKYAHKGYRYTSLDGGVVAQSLSDMGALLGFEAWFSAAFNDAAIRNLLDIPTNAEIPLFVLYLVPAPGGAR